MLSTIAQKINLSTNFLRIFKNQLVFICLHDKLKYKLISMTYCLNERQAKIKIEFNYD